ncbi:MarR family transcriptional regulator [Plectosphaerella plurivora]|uniref:MarR family transcriptional regulator n=1 Tax=Plectosphaerella plurivora TaxID=936078 RepID=A0A9P9A9M5_9PEZI|nr:MarR family transcriptional regulator [Plectosphaerella plurivora]
MPSVIEPTLVHPAGQDPIPPIRDASRKLVRELGFMRRTLAGTNLSAAAVHALLEIGDHGIRNRVELHARLKLDGARGGDFEAAVAELLKQGEIVAEPPFVESLPTSYRLTPQGESTLRSVNAFAVARIQEALDAAAPGIGEAIALGLKAYAEALAATSPAPSPVADPQPRTGVRVEPGYRPGFLARTLQMHMDYYSATLNWGLSFETSLARDFGDLIKRLEGNPDNQIWAALQEPAVPGGAERIVGTILLDAEDLGEPGTAHIRGFIMDEDVRGMGVGKKLLGAVLEFVELRGFDKVVLFTMGRLAAAVYMYRKAGFELEGEKEENLWDQQVTVQKFVWKRTRDEDPSV